MSITLTAKNTDLSLIQRQIETYRKVPVRISDIVYDDRKFVTNDYTVSRSAVRQLANICSIKDQLVSEVHDNEGQWSPLRKALTSIKQDKLITGVVDTETRMITHFRDAQLKEEAPLRLQRGLDMLEELLEKNKAVSLHDARFNPTSLRIEADLREVQNEIDVFGNKQDVWNSGVTFNFLEKCIVVAPFLLRLICTNGMSVTQSLERRFLQGDARSSTAISMVNKMLTTVIPQQVQSNCDRLVSHTASVGEFEELRNIVSGISADLIDQYTPEAADIKNAYSRLSIDLTKQGGDWKKQANSNINAYELFNRATHCASHVADIDDQTRFSLNRFAGKMFMSGPDRATTFAPDPFLPN